VQDSFVNMWKSAVDYIVLKNQQGQFIRERTMALILKKILDEYDPNFVDLRSPCGACISQLAYNFDGDIYSCDEARMINSELFKIGNVNQAYMDVVCGKTSCAIINSSLNEGSFCDLCAFKPFCGLCPVVNFVETNSLIPMTVSNFRCRVLKSQLSIRLTNCSLTANLSR